MEKVVKNFYYPFNENLEKKYDEVEKQKPKEEITDKLCPKCQKPLAVKMGRFGKFLACTGFPECKHTEPLENKNISLNIICPKCNIGEIMQKKTRKGKVFYACSKWPDCDFALWDKPNGERCKMCGSLMVLKGKNCLLKNCS